MLLVCFHAFLPTNSASQTAAQMCLTVRHLSSVHTPAIGFIFNPQTPLVQSLLSSWYFDHLLFLEFADGALKVIYILFLKASFRLFTEHQAAITDWP